MKLFFGTVLFILFSINNTHLSAQTDIIDIDVLERYIDSLGRVKESKPSVTEVQLTDPSNLKEINITRKIRQIEVEGDVTVFLTNGPSDKLWLKGNLNDLDRVQIKGKNENLIVDAKKIKREANIFSYNFINYYF